MSTADFSLSDFNFDKKTKPKSTETSKSKVSTLNPDVQAFTFSNVSTGVAKSTQSAPTSPDRTVGSEFVPDVKLQQQLSYYFSEHNLIKDHFLISQMTPDNFVPIALIAAFPAVKKLTMDINLVVDVLRNIPGIEVSADAKMVRPVYMPPVMVNSFPPNAFHYGGGTAAVGGAGGVSIAVRGDTITATTPPQELSALLPASLQPREIKFEADAWVLSYDGDDVAQQALRKLKQTKFKDSLVQATVNANASPRSNPISPPFDANNQFNGFYDPNMHYQQYPVYGGVPMMPYPNQYGAYPYNNLPHNKQFNNNNNNNNNNNGNSNGSSNVRTTGTVRRHRELVPSSRERDATPTSNSNAKAPVGGNPNMKPNPTSSSNSNNKPITNPTSSTAPSTTTGSNAKPNANPTINSSASSTQISDSKNPSSTSRPLSSSSSSTSTNSRPTSTSSTTTPSGTSSTYAGTKPTAPRGVVRTRKEGVRPNHRRTNSDESDMSTVANTAARKANVRAARAEFNGSKSQKKPKAVNEKKKKDQPTPKAPDFADENFPALPGGNTNVASTTPPPTTTTPATTTTGATTSTTASTKETGGEKVSVVTEAAPKVPTTTTPKPFVMSDVVKGLVKTEPTGGDTKASSTVTTAASTANTTNSNPNKPAPNKAGAKGGASNSKARDASTKDKPKPTTTASTTANPRTKQAATPSKEKYVAKRTQSNPKSNDDRSKPNASANAKSVPVPTPAPAPAWGKRTKGTATAADIVSGKSAAPKPPPNPTASNANTNTNTNTGAGDGGNSAAVKKDGHNKNNNRQNNSKQSNASSQKDSRGNSRKPSPNSSSVSNSNGKTTTSSSSSSSSTTSTSSSATTKPAASWGKPNANDGKPSFAQMLMNSKK